MTRIRPGLLPVLLLLPATQDSQPASQAATRPALQELADRMARAQRTGQAPPEVSGFRAYLTIDPVKGDHAIQFRGWLSYCRPGMLRFKLDGDPKIVEIMFDGKTYWQVDLNGKPEELTRKETKSARDEMDRRLSLCEQIARLLYVDKALLRMKDGQVREVPDYKQSGDKQTTPALHVRGTLDDYPLYHASDYRGRVALELWLRKDGLKPLALRATPLDRLPPREGEPRRIPFTEELQFGGNETASGVMVPDEVRLYLVDGKGQLQLRFCARIDELQLNPKLGKADFQPK